MYGQFGAGLGKLRKSLASALASISSKAAVGWIRGKSSIGGADTDIDIRFLIATMRIIFRGSPIGFKAFEYEGEVPAQ